eukprot:tig00001304_g8112.t1
MERARRLRSPSAWIAVALLASLASIAAAAAVSSSTAGPKSYIVQFDDLAAGEAVGTPGRRPEGADVGRATTALLVRLRSAAASVQGETPVFNVGHEYQRVFPGFSATMSERVAEMVRASPLVALIEEDGIATGSQVNVTQQITSSGLWGLDRTNQRALPLDNKYSYAADGAGVGVYVLDSGIFTAHVQFEGRAVPFYDAITLAGGSAADCHGHGTHVAGTIGGKDYGIAKKVNLYAVRVLGCDNTGPCAVAAGITVVVAAMNSNLDACTVSPASAPNVITVGATTNTDARASYSNFGTCIDIFAPGSSVLSASHTSTTGGVTMSGTSMATPHVSGVAALYLSANPAAKPAEVTYALKNVATKNAVINAGTGSPNLLLYSSFDELVPMPTPTPSPSPTPVPPPTTCPQSTAVAACTTVSGDTRGKASLLPTQTSGEAFFTFNVARTGSYTFSTCGLASWDTVIYVYSGCPISGLGPSTLLATNDNGCGGSLKQSQTTVALTAGSAYTVAVEGKKSAAGAFQMSITPAAPLTCPLEIGTAAAAGVSSLAVEVGAENGDSDAEEAAGGSGSVNVGLVVGAVGGAVGVAALTALAVVAVLYARSRRDVAANASAVPARPATAAADIETPSAAALAGSVPMQRNICVA